MLLFADVGAMYTLPKSQVVREIRADASEQNEGETVTLLDFPSAQRGASHVRCFEFIDTLMCNSRARSCQGNHEETLYLLAIFSRIRNDSETHLNTPHVVSSVALGITSRSVLVSSCWLAFARSRKHPCRFLKFPEIISGLYVHDKYGCSG